MTLAETARAGDEVDGCDGSTVVAALQATDALLNGRARQPVIISCCLCFKSTPRQLQLLRHGRADEMGLRVC